MEVNPGIPQPSAQKHVSIIYILHGNRFGNYSKLCDKNFQLQRNTCKLELTDFFFDFFSVALAKVQTDTSVKILRNYDIYIFCCFQISRKVRGSLCYGCFYSPDDFRLFNWHSSTKLCLYLCDQNYIIHIHIP